MGLTRGTSGLANPVPGESGYTYVLFLQQIQGKIGESGG